MKFSAAALVAAAAGAAAHGHAANTTVVPHVVITTEVFTAYTTYCPVATEVTMGNQTYTVTKATTLTISDCPCTITRPVTTYTTAPASSYVKPYGNSTTEAVSPSVPAATAPGVTKSIGTISPSASKTAPSSIATAGAGKSVTFSGAALAGVLGLAAFAL